MKLQALEARVYRVLIQGEVPPYYARKAALAIVRDTHEQRVRQIREASARGMSCRQIARQLGVCKSTVSNVLSNRSGTDWTPTAGTIDARNDEHTGP